MRLRALVPTLALLPLLLAGGAALRAELATSADAPATTDGERCDPATDGSDYAALDETRSAQPVRSPVRGVALTPLGHDLTPLALATTRPFRRLR